ncbi:EpsG family protein [Companilactobacillus farciminis]|uniref:EpsG family protein n=1 Tax=Companilactobacillus farciminis TaxID=1612 RepID=UPI0023305C5E|nr:EpsG family protein [Companilactobacillus farciminis]WCG36000.1 EpsG family protein [Companilactobacillus farciminis]
MAVYLSIVMFLSLIVSYTDMVKIKKIFFIVVISALSILAMLYDPIKGYLDYGMYTDTYRMFKELDMFRYYGWNADKILQGTPNMTTNYESIIVAKAYMYFCAMVTKNNHILPLINSVLTYGSIALGLSMIGKKIKADSVMIVSSFVTFILINDYYLTVTNIRLPLAMALFILIWSRQIVSNKRSIWQYIFYVLMCLLHSAMFIFLAIKLIVDFTSKKLKNFFIVVMLASSLFLNQLISLLQRFASVGAFVSGLLQKVVFYSDSNGYVGVAALKANYRFVIFDLIRISYFLFLIYVLSRASQKNKDFIKSNSGITSLITFGELLVAFAIGALWSYHLFHRTVLFMVMIIPVYLVIIAKYYNVRILPLKRLNVFSIITWIFVLINVIYYFFGFSYNQLVI